MLSNSYAILILVIIALCSTNCVSQEPTNPDNTPNQEPINAPNEPVEPNDTIGIDDPEEPVNDNPNEEIIEPNANQIPIQQQNVNQSPIQQQNVNRGIPRGIPNPRNFQQQVRQNNNAQNRNIVPAEKGAPVKSSEFKEFTLSGPYTYKNLTMFLVHAPDTFPSQGVLTLSEALDQNLVMVYETSSVNNLAIENVSEKYHVYLQAGDIVKGGKQDRTMGYDMVLSPKSGKLDLPAFCVESGRWRGRGQESSHAFAENTNMVSSKALKQAVRGVKSQSEVWENVSTLQSKLSTNVGEDIRDERSSSSLQLALENEKLQNLKAEYIQNLEKIVEQQQNVRGFVFGIHGQINCAEVYGSSVIFAKMWNKLLNAAVIEAIAEQNQPAGDIPSITTEQVKEFLVQVEQAQARGVKVGNRTQNVEQETDAVQMFEARDIENADEWIHRQYIKK